MFVRKKPNKSGSTSIQIVDKSSGTYKVIQSIGVATDPEEIEGLLLKAHQELARLQKQKTFAFASQRDEAVLDFTRTLSNSNVVPIGSQLVFGRIYDKIGFKKIQVPLLKELVLSRIIYQGSKLKLTQYLRRYENRSISVQRIYRFMDTFHSRYKAQAEQIAFAHTKKILGTIHVVFYDMTTLYFEAEDEDDLRKIGFSKDGKFQNPQVMLGLLVGEKGYPIGYELFEGNTWEGHTLIPVLEAFGERFDLDKPIVVADSGLLSKSNITLLESKGYGYIIGARIKKEKEALSKEILSLGLKEDIKPL